MSDDEVPEIDWAALRLSTTNLTEMIRTYYLGLCAAGFESNEALALTLAYQQAFLEQMHR